MRLCTIHFALLPLCFFIAKVDASANATASPASLGAISSTRGRSSALVSESPAARDEERVHGIEDIGLGNHISTILTRSKQAVWGHYVSIQHGLQVAWLMLKNEDPYIIYTKLGLDMVNEDILSNFWFRVWVKYVEGYNYYHPELQVSISAHLWGQFGDYKLAMMLEEAKEDADKSLQAIAMRLQSELMASWRRQGYDSHRLYTVLQPDPSHPTLLTGQAYNIWDTYFSEINHGELMLPLDQLLHTFDDASLSSLLIASKQSKVTAARATDLQLQLEKEWLEKGLSPKLVFKYLKLDETPDALLDNPELEVWTRYADKYWVEKEKRVTLNEIIGSVFKKDEIETIIGTAKTDDGKKLAENLQKKLAEEL